MRKLIYISLAIVAIMTSCRKDVVQNDYEADRDEVYLTVEHTADGNPYVQGDTLVDDYGSAFVFTDVKMYMSNFRMDSTDLTKYILLDGVNNTYLLGDVEQDSYTNFTYHVGIDSLTNHGDPLVWDPGHPLYFTNGTFWGWAEGYLFVIIEGLVDSDNNGTLDLGFIMHCGADSFYTEGGFALPVSADGQYSVGLQVDWRRMMDSVDIKNENLTHTTDNLPLAKKVMSNVPSAITPL